MPRNDAHTLFRKFRPRGASHRDHDSDEYQLIGIQAHYPGTISEGEQGEETTFLGRFKSEAAAIERGKEWERIRRSYGVTNPTWTIVRTSR